MCANTFLLAKRFQNSEVTSIGIHALQGHFVCPVTDWTINYYDPIQKNLDKMKDKYAENQTALSVITMLQAEINLYRRHSGEYGYVFYAMKNKI